MRFQRFPTESSRAILRWLMKCTPLPSRRLECNCNLAESLQESLFRAHEKLKNGDILIVTSKVVSLAEGRTVELSSITPSARAKKLKFSRYGSDKEDPRIVELVLQESEKVFPGSMLIGLKDGNLLPSAGIDLSNAPKGMAILLPRNPWKSAWDLRTKLIKKYRLKTMGVIICDSRCQPLRWGTVGIALAWAGIDGITDHRGKKDLFGHALKFTRGATADNLASAAELLMGESNESTPFVLIRNAPVKFSVKRSRPADFRISPKDCIFESIYNSSFLNRV